MIARIIQWSLKDRLFVVLGAVLLLAWGIHETLQMPVDVFPDLTAPTVTVVVEAIKVQVSVRVDHSKRSFQSGRSGESMRSTLSMC